MFGKLFSNCTVNEKVFGKLFSNCTVTEKFYKIRVATSLR